MDFVAVDFETANSNANSACQLAAVVVRDSQVVFEQSWMIRPPRMYFSPFNIKVHGITPEDVRHAPTMDKVWSEFQPLIDGQVLLAHNARFDVGVLLASLAAKDIACPPLEFICTRLLARQTWPGRTKYGLKPLSDWLGIEFKHHDALEDSRACATIALEAERVHQTSELRELEKILRIKRGSYQQGHVKSPRAVGKRSSARASGSRTTNDKWGFPSRTAKVARKLDAQTVLQAAGNQPPLQGKNIVLLGNLGGMSEAESTQFLSALGAARQPTIDASTHYVVTCRTSENATDQAPPALPAPHLQSSSSTRGRTSGGVRVLSERQFRAILPAGRVSLP
ncbi:exonuclease domain-containing protein [Aureliella helgolandensis]|uniref:DNA polymerase III PolC-type n=1 Tax=Aureliella helgolandensis TaxID=2527968 RepID=A0A518GFS1_9BACT|nr:exonuclease domain-containing protein [Aureliella helgolandensis]QDV27420.1 DNA polymerase III PolC-type [Aureliella helgolandensis]